MHWGSTNLDEMQAFSSFLPSIKHRIAVKFVFTLQDNSQDDLICCNCPKGHDWHTDKQTGYLTPLAMW